MERKAFLCKQSHTRINPLGKCLRLCTFMLALFLWAGTVVQAQSLQKEIRIKAENESLAVILKKISNASGYKINFNMEDVRDMKTSVDTGDGSMTVTAVLDRLFQKLPFSYKVDKGIHHRHAQTSTSSIRKETCRNRLHL